MLAQDNHDVKQNFSVRMNKEKRRVGAVMLRRGVEPVADVFFASVFPQHRGHAVGAEENGGAVVEQG